MNKSINMVTGDYVYFLNCGDTFHSNHTVKEVVEFLSRNKTEILFGNIQNVYTDHKQIEYYNNLKIRSSSFLKGQSICHQAIFADRKIFEDIQFDEQYKICADKNWIIECMVNNKNFMHANILICDFDKHGISANPQNSYVIKSETNKMLKGRFPIKFYLFKSIRFVPMFFRR
nr:hypothetical protein [Priestia aryabhattai]